MWGFVAAAGLGAVLLGGALWTAGPLTPAMAIHAALMVTAWGVLMPMGGVLARYFKVTPGQDFPREVDNLFWFTWHRRLQYGGIGLASVGLAVILSETGGRLDTLHGRCGLAVMSIGWLQVLSALLRGSKGGPTGVEADPGDPSTWRGDHFDMTRRRRRFEAWHKRAGWAALGLAGVTILLGASLAAAPDWLFGVAGILQGALGFGLLDGILHGRWVDTYVAIWGPDLVSPAVPRSGNRVIPSKRFGTIPD